MASEPENTSTSTNTVDSQIPPGFGPEAFQALSVRSQRIENEKALLQQQIADIRLLIERSIIKNVKFSQVWENILSGLTACIGRTVYYQFNKLMIRYRGLDQRCEYRFVPRLSPA